MLEMIDKDANGIFSQVCCNLNYNGISSSPRGLKTIELEDVFIEITDPTEKNCIISLPERDLSMDYLSGEMDWYLNGTLDSEEIKKHSSFWGKIESPFGKLNSNYGFICFKEVLNGMSQYDWCLKSLREDIESRQAIINYNQPKHKYDGNKDFVCTLNQAFRVKNGKLHTRVFMRSTDLIFGFSYDIYWFGYLLRKLAQDLKLEVGSLYFYTISMHIYERHFKILDSFVESRPS